MGYYMGNKTCHVLNSEVNYVTGIQLRKSFIVEIDSNNYTSGSDEKKVEISWPEVSQEELAALNLQSISVCWCQKNEGNCKVCMQSWQKKMSSASCI